MSRKELTIAGAAHSVLQDMGGELTVEKIYEQITTRGLYNFNTPTPIAVLAEQIRRHCDDLQRGVAYDPVLFYQTADGRYGSTQLRCAPRKTASMRRIHRAADKEGLINKLTSGDPPVFKEIWRLILFAATLGQKHKRLVPLGKVDTGKGIDARIFDNSPAWPGILHLISLVEDPDPQSLSASSEERRLELFEQYANGGLQILHDELEPKSFSTEAVIAFMNEQILEPAEITSDQLADLTL